MRAFPRRASRSCESRLCARLQLLEVLLLDCCMPGPTCCVPGPPAGAGPPCCILGPPAGAGPSCCMLGPPAGAGPPCCKVVTPFSSSFNDSLSFTSTHLEQYFNIKSLTDEQTRPNVCFSVITITVQKLVPRCLLHCSLCLEFLWLGTKTTLSYTCCYTPRL